ncbi:DUF3592 domain-containing protein [Verrucomicrobiaceae bacterium 227]
MRLFLSSSPGAFLIPIIMGTALLWMLKHEHAGLTRSRSFISTPAILDRIYYDPKAEDDSFFYEGILTDSGSKFRSSRVFFGSSHSHAVYQKIVDTYPIGTPCEVLVNPHDPKEVVLRKGALGLGFHVFLWIGIIILVAGLIGFARAVKISWLHPNPLSQGSSS